MKSLNVNINENLHRRVKSLAALQGRKLMEIVVEALQDLLIKYGENQNESENL